MYDRPRGVVEHRWGLFERADAVSGEWRSDVTREQCRGCWRDSADCSCTADEEVTPCPTT